MGTPVHFTINASDPARAQAFYSAVLDWKFSQLGDMPYWGIETGEDATIGGGMVQRTGDAPAAGQPANSFVLTVLVEDCDATAESAVANGGAIAVAKTTLPGLGWTVHISDTEGNIFGAMQHDPSAA
ncbi:VOC family protein [Allokutzneria multivorans]|uniref:VOC family protein n=1 Tax=Allokutzneria multivorans TaxID=1142134 RepID=A0ABP7SNG3_9PSEU